MTIFLQDKNKHSPRNTIKQNKSKIGNLQLQPQPKDGDILDDNHRKLRNDNSIIDCRKRSLKQELKYIEDN